MRRFTLVEVLIALAFVGILSVGGYTAYYNFKHPCVRYESQICTRSVCTVTMNPTLPQWHPDQHCMAWAEEEFPCRVCTERKP